ncbi:unnamed protein product [Phaeothamnion confervicola]
MEDSNDRSVAGASMGVGGVPAAVSAAVQGAALPPVPVAAAVAAAGAQAAANAGNAVGGGDGGGKCVEGSMASGKNRSTEGVCAAASPGIAGGTGILSQLCQLPTPEEYLRGGR